PEVKGHMIILDKIFENSETGKTVARIRDPFHGWVIDVGIESFMKRALAEPYTEIAFIADKSKSADVSKEVDYTSLSRINSSESKYNFLSVYERIGREIAVARPDQTREYSRLCVEILKRYDSGPGDIGF